MTTHTEVTADAGAFAVLYARVQQFYARQMQAFDRGDAREWANTFTADAVFDVPTLPAPLHGRAAIAASLTRAAAETARAGVRLRHVVSMSDVTARGAGRVEVRSCTTVYATTVGGASRVHRMCVCEDVLELAADGGLLVSRRRVTRDDL
ncbi:nuclear transport factor 2 family protein [Streptomyces sp. NPDC051684]|uniref:nuclear transport factor 2 family protein n=1 Tax=Streptomyces sp. NPDC051684 TaxID=3365670 RepID=UPI0037AE3414